MAYARARVPSQVDTIAVEPTRFNERTAIYKSSNGDVQALAHDPASK